MPPATTKSPSSDSEVRSTLRSRLEARRAEIEATALTRVEAIAGPEEERDPIYVDGLRAAVSAAIDFAFEAIEAGDEEGAPPPAALLDQARAAARYGIGLDVVLRRYVSGYTLLRYFLLEEATRDGLMSAADLQQLSTGQAALFDRLLAAVAREHEREADQRALSSGRRLEERIRRLLKSDVPDLSGIDYDFAGWHLGAVALGGEAEVAIRGLAADLNLDRLLVGGGEREPLWVWLGAAEGPESLLSAVARLERLDHGGWIAVGEPASGLAGWRLTHRQAAAALPLARRGPCGVVRYADVAVEATALQDRLLSTSLRKLYLDPLKGERDGGAALKATLRAYLAANGNVTSAAAMIGVSPRTVRNRLAKVEDLIGRRLDQVLPELQTALRLQALEAVPTASPIMPLGSR